MTANIVVPQLGESVTEATVAKWLKVVGDPVKVDEPLLELETDKVTLEIYASAAGTLTEVVVPAGATVEVGAVLGVIGNGAAKPSAPSAPAQAAPAKAAPAKAAAAPAAAKPAPSVQASPPVPPLAPSVRKLVAENSLEPAAIPASGKGGRLTKGDVVQHLDQAKSAPPVPAIATPAAGPREERVRMTRLRKRIAERLKEAQNTAAILTTFNEVDMGGVMALRTRMKDEFEQRHGVKLGFMSFFVKACVVALREIPAVNAEIDGEDIVYKNHYDIGVAVGIDQGLVVPVVRDADRLDFAGIEKTIAALALRAREGKLTIEELTGGTFTITNGGTYGSLLSTPILNPPQAGILGMHKIQKRAVVIDDRIEIRPMMYVALSYDHRLIDGREAVTFLVRVKECLEDPQRLLLGV